MAIADGGSLIILAPGIKKFGEDPKIDTLIRKYGYVGTPGIMKEMDDNPELKHNLSAVAHLIHGSTEGRFTVTYCPGFLSKDEIEGVGFKYGDLKEMTARYRVEALEDGWNTTEEGETVFYVSNPALGLWAHESRFKDGDDEEEEDEKGGEKDEEEDSKKKEGITNFPKQEGVDGSGGVGGWKKS